MAEPETQADAADKTEQNKGVKPEQEQAKDASEQAPVENEQDKPSEEAPKDEVAKDDDQKSPEKDATEKESEPKDVDEKEKEKEKEKAKEDDKKPSDKDEKTEAKQDAKEEKKEPPKEPSEFQLYYWKDFGGRGTLARLCMVVCGAEWDEKNQDHTKDVKGADIKGFPNFALPILQHGDNIISQTPAICVYIMEKYGFTPVESLDKVYALQVVLTAHDASGEWYNKINKLIGFDGWITKRIGSFLSTLQNQLKRNNEGKGWFFGDKVCVADVFVADFMRRYKFNKADHYKANKFDVLKAHCKRFEELENVKKYLESVDYKKVKGSSGWGAL